MLLLSIETAPVPLDAETYLGEKREYTQIILETELIALTKNNYIPLTQEQISLCAKIGYMYYCEYAHLLKKRMEHTCMSAIYYDQGSDIKVKQCKTIVTFDTIPESKILDASDLLILSNLQKPWTIACKDISRVLEIEYSTYRILNRLELCECSLTAGNYLLSYMNINCGNAPEARDSYFTTYYSFNKMDIITENFDIQVGENTRNQATLLHDDIPGYDLPTINFVQTTTDTDEDISILEEDNLQIYAHLNNVLVHMIDNQQTAIFKSNEDFNKNKEKISQYIKYAENWQVASVICSYTEMACDVLLIVAMIIFLLKYHKTMQVMLGGSRKILSDNGTEFKNKVFEEIVEKLGCEVRAYSPPYRPQSNGRIECFHKFLKACMGKHINPRLEWDEVIPMATAAYNFFPHTTSKERLFYLMFGHDPLTGLEKLLRDTVRYFGESGGRLDLTVLQNTYQLAAQNVQKAREKAEGKEPLVPLIFQSGDLVTLHDHTAKAFNPKYKGEYRIVKMLGKTQVLLRNARGEEMKHHVTHIKKTNPVEETVDKIPDFKMFSRAVKLHLNPDMVPNLVWEYEAAEVSTIACSEKNTFSTKWKLISKILILHSCVKFIYSAVNHRRRLGCSADITKL